MIFDVGNEGEKKKTPTTWASGFNKNDPLAKISVKSLISRAINSHYCLTDIFCM